MLSTLRQVAEWFGGVHGRRKTMLLVSEGIDYDINDIIRSYDAPRSSATSIMSDIREAIDDDRAVQRQHLRGRSARARHAGRRHDRRLQLRRQADPAPDIGIGSLNNELRLSQDSLRWLSEETGGFAAVNRNDTTNAFERIVRDNSSYYVLAYYPPSDKRDGKFHKIEVKVNRPGLTVRSRRGYALPKNKQAPKQTKTGGMSPEVFEAMNSPLAVERLDDANVRCAVQGPPAQCVGGRRHRDERPRSEPRARTARSTSRSWRSTTSRRSSARETIR